MFARDANINYVVTSVFHRGGREMPARKALVWVVFWICAALCFNAGVYLLLGREKALEFLGGYILEKGLSVDNLFLFLFVFSSFGIRLKDQRRVLDYGIFFAVVFRLLFILFGVIAVNNFHWLLYVFGAALVFSGMRMVFSSNEGTDYKNSGALKMLKRIMPVTDTMRGECFFIVKNGRRHATPLLAVLIIIEFSDILFAVDSIPAIFSITTDIFIVYTSNIFAILGLRSMYFLLRRLHDKFRFVKYGAAMILTFTGIKLLIPMFGIDISVIDSLAVILVIMLGSIILSLIFSERCVIIEYKAGNALHPQKKHRIKGG
ncbi:MAG: TerC/Alx family metal homeostasis membrane protein [Clostridiaceae bacterium]|nr:TerC/Alx family metal homeostasis membrane protein [Clostridiaceae bacterium]